MVEYITLRIYRCYYRATVYNHDKQTKQTKMNKAYDYIEFLELHAGPEYCIYYKCANTIMMVFITLIFGPALPILYIISLFSICCQYLLERLTLAYFYRIPPKFSDKLTLLNIKIMQFAPIPSLLFTFWLYGNK
jgi:hypothetical protein